MAGTQAVEQVAGAQVLDQVAGTLVLDKVAGVQVLAPVTGVQLLDQVTGCNISTLSANQKVDRLLNHFTPGDGYEFAHQAGAEGGEQMEDVCSTGLAYRIRVAGAFPCEVWRVL